MKLSAYLQDTRVGGAPGEIRTPDLLVRSQTLYPTELQARQLVPILPSNHAVQQPELAA